MNGSTATMTTAPSTQIGVYWNVPVPNMRSGATISADSAPDSCVRAPASSRIVERVIALVTTMPWKNPAATLLAPIAAISWFGFMS